MKPRQINEGRNGTIWVPDSVERWDGPSAWERVRLDSMQEHLRPGMVTFDVGTEHGWLDILIAQWVGPRNMVLIEPTQAMWQDIALTWRANFPNDDPLACWPGLVGEKRVAKKATFQTGWPSFVDFAGGESPAGLDYRSLIEEREDEQIETTTIDILAKALRVKVDVLNIDVEGAEWSVLRGATKTLTTDRPLVWCSVHPDMMQRDYGIEHVEEMFDWMDGLGYRREYLGTDHEQHMFWHPSEWSPS